MYISGNNDYEILKSKMGIYVDEKRKLSDREREEKIAEMAKIHSIMLPTMKQEKAYKVYDPERTKNRENPQYQYTNFVDACLTISKRKSTKEYSEDIDKIETIRHKIFNEELLYLASYQLKSEEALNVEKYGFDFIELDIPNEIKEIEKKIFKYQQAIDTLETIRKIYKDHFHKFEKDYHFERTINDDIKYYESRIKALEKEIELLQEKYQKELKARIDETEAKRAKRIKESLKASGLDNSSKKNIPEDNPEFDYDKIFEEAFKDIDVEELQGMKTNLASSYKPSSKEDSDAIFSYEELFGSLTHEDKEAYEKYKKMREELDNLIMNKDNYRDEDVFKEEVVLKMQKYNLGITYEEIIRNLGKYRDSLKVCQSMNYIVISIMLEYTDQDQMLILENNRLTSFENSVKERCTLILNHGNIPTELREELTYYRDRLNALEHELKITFQNQRLMYMPEYKKVLEEIRTKYLINTSVLNEMKQAPTDTDGHKR